MTHGLRETTGYIKSCTDAMNRYVEYAKTNKDHDVDWRRHWAITVIESEYRQGFGALQLAFIYLEEIEEEDHYTLKDQLFKEWKKAEERCWEEIE